MAAQKHLSRAALAAAFIAVLSAPALARAQSAAEGFNPDTNATVHMVATQPNDGKILAGGEFTTLGSGGTGVTGRTGLGSLAVTDAGLQTLAVNADGTTITWSRGGGGPEVSRVTFESSPDGSSYTSLGNGTYVAGAWELTRQSLAIETNFFVRARGYHAGSIVESVRNVYIDDTTPPTVTTGVATLISGRTATLNGTANPHDNATTAGFEYGLTTAYGSTTPVQSLGSGNTADAIGGGGITDLACGATYHFRATATNTNGTTTGSDATFTTTACAAPTIGTIDDASIGVNGALGPVVFSIGDDDEPAETLALSASSSNPTLVPTTNIILGGSADTRLVTVTPAANQLGTATITVQVMDAEGLTASETFTVSVKYDTVTTILADTPDPSEPDESVTVSYRVDAGDYSPAAPAPTGHVVITVAESFDTCTGTVAQGQCTLTFTGGDGERTIFATYGGDADSNISVGITSHTVRACPVVPVVTNTADDGPGSLRAAIAAACPTDTITFDLDGDTTQLIGLTSGEVTIDKNLTIVGPLDEALWISGQATSRVFAIASGASVTLQNLTILGGTAANGGAIANQGELTILDSLLWTNAATDNGGAIWNDGALTLKNSTLSGNSAAFDGGALFVTSGHTATLVNVTIAHNTAGDEGGGIANGGTLSITNSIVAANTATTAGENVFGTIATDSHNVLSGDPKLAPVDSYGGPTFTYPLLPGSPAIDAGLNSAAADAGLTTDQRGFPRVRDILGAAPARIDIGAFEADPMLEALANATIEANTIYSATFRLGDPATAFDAITATSSNPNLVPDGEPNLSIAGSGGSRTLTVTPLPDQVGTTTITVTVTKTFAGMPLSASSSFELTVVTVNLPPTLDPPLTPVTMAEDAPAQSVPLTGITDGGDTGDQTLTITATSDTPVVIPNPIPVTYTNGSLTGSLSFTPAANATGSAIITVTVTDDGAVAKTVSRQIAVTVTAVNDAPTLNPLRGETILEDAAPQAVTLSGITAGPGESQTLTVTASSNNPGVIPNPTVTYASASATGMISYTPVANAHGTVIMTVTVTDNGGTASGGVNTISRSFTVEVTSVNDVPTLDPIATPALIQEDDLSIKTALLTGISAGGGDNQTLIFVATSGNTGLIPHPTVHYTPGSTTGSLTYAVAGANLHGSALITLQISDGGGGIQTVTRTFIVTVGQVNDAPTIGGVPPQTIMEESTTGPLPFTIGDQDGLAGLTVTATSSNTMLVPNHAIVLGGSGANRTVTVTPAHNQAGETTITLTVGDGTATASSAFLLTVTDDHDSPDLIWQHPTGPVAAWLMAGASYTGVSTTVSGSQMEWKVIASADFTGDGEADLLWQHPQGAVVIWEIRNHQFSGNSQTVVGGTTDWHLVSAADLNGDAQPDLIWQHPSGQVAVWTMQGMQYGGNGTTLYGGSTEWRVMAAADFTGDGHPDLVWQHPGGQVAVWEMQGTQYTGNATTLTGNASEWRIAGTGDYNGNGEPDLVWQHPTGSVVIWIFDRTLFTGDSRTVYGGGTEWRLIGR